MSRLRSRVAVVGLLVLPSISAPGKTRKIAGQGSALTLLKVIYVTLSFVFGTIAQSLEQPSLIPYETNQQRSWHIEGGVDAELIPEAGIFFEPILGWEAGIHLTSWALGRKMGYDFMPQAGLSIRKLWLSPQDAYSLRNSEYFEITGGAFPSYGLASFSSLLEGDVNSEPHAPRTGAGFFIGAGMGKYWMPVREWPFGLTVALSLQRFLNHFPPGFNSLDRVAIQFRIYWANDYGALSRESSQ